jgi:ribosomal protein L20A (L18A)
MEKCSVKDSEGLLSRYNETAIKDLTAVEASFRVNAYDHVYMHNGSRKKRIRR